MRDEHAVDDELVRALVEEIDVERIEGDRDWNAQLWIPEYAEPVLGEELFNQLEERLRAIPGVERLVWEDREVFLARIARDADLAALRERVTDVVRGAIRDAGYGVP